MQSSTSTQVTKADDQQRLCIKLAHHRYDN